MLFMSAVSMFASSDAMAENLPLTNKQLEKAATHIVVGKVQAIYSRKERVGNYEYMRFLAEVKVDKQQKGDGPEDLVYVRYFTIGWNGPGKVPEGPSGHFPLPKQGNTHRFYLSQYAYDGFSLSKDGGFNVVYGNGVQPADPPQRTGAEQRKAGPLSARGQHPVAPVSVMNVTVKGGSFQGLRFSADGSRIWTNRLESWSVPSGKKLDSAPVAKQKGPYVFDTSPAGKRMLIVDQQSGTLIWDQDRPPRERALPKNGPVRFVQFLGKGDRFAALLSDPPSVWMGNVDSNKDDKVLSLPFETQRRGGFSESGRLLAFRKARDVVAVWDLELNQQRCLLQHDDSVFSVAISPDGRFVATGASDNVVRVFSTVKGETVARLKGHGEGTIFLTSAVYSLAFSRNGRYLASGGHDGRVIVWDVESGKTVIEAQVTGQPIVWSVTFSPDSRLVAGGFVAAGAKHGLSVWKLPSGQPPKEYPAESW